MLHHTEFGVHCPQRVRSAKDGRLSAMSASRLTPEVRTGQLLHFLDRLADQPTGFAGPEINQTHLRERPPSNRGWVHRAALPALSEGRDAFPTRALLPRGAALIFSDERQHEGEKPCPNQNGSTS